jgi:hypothetical protein
VKETPVFIYLKEDDEDPSHIVWTNNDMGDNEVSYVRKDVVDEWLETQRQDKERYRQIAIRAAEWFERINSADGSGHADLGRNIRDLVSKVEK